MKKHVLSENRKSRFEYFFESEVEAGLVLQGWEVKSMKAGNFSIAEAYITFKGDECWLSGCSVDSSTAVAFGCEADKTRNRKLLLNKKEILKLKQKVGRDGVTAIPATVYLKNGLIKVRVVEGRGKKLHDKRNTVSERQWNIQQKRILKEIRKV